MAYIRSEGLPHCLITLKKKLLLHNNLVFKTDGSFFTARVENDQVYFSNYPIFNFQINLKILRESSWGHCEPSRAFVIFS